MTEEESVDFVNQRRILWDTVTGFVFQSRRNEVYSVRGNAALLPSRNKRVRRNFTAAVARPFSFSAPRLPRIRSPFFFLIDA